MPLTLGAGQVARRMLRFNPAQQLRRAFHLPQAGAAAVVDSQELPRVIAVAVVNEMMGKVELLIDGCGGGIPDGQIVA